MKVYAQYRSCCTVSFDAAGGSGSMGQMTGSVGSSAEIPKVAFTRPGFAATDWTETRASYSMYCVYGRICQGYLDSGAWGAGDRLVLDRSYVLQPEWQPAWTVTFNANGGSLGAGAQMPTEVFWNKEPRLLDLNSFARSGYKFAGWNTKGDGSGTAYSQRQVITPPADITLYAQWSCTSCFTVSFNANGGTATMASQTA
ncbi:MAG: InlB B-repeat-containing protein, partial [Chloroflexota bacterium]